jgi:3-hydroxyisobutyrate dehydrogenase-like beta-hydroxyacid dehydrogenase
MEGSGMTAIGFIGSGRIGGTVARLAVAAGYDVVLSNSRGPHTLEDLVGELGPGNRVATPAEAAAAGDLAFAVGSSPAMGRALRSGAPAGPASRRRAGYPCGLCSE